RRTSALRARFGGIAAKPHTCADRSVFCPGRAGAKNGFQKPASRAKLGFSTSCYITYFSIFNLIFQYLFKLILYFV
ncbi:MAG: hypothetical protein J6A19_00505, partial [Oscillospiraceae bacterium]|nr:hypothetical protein [Oscillospiraceae bacterium]